MPPVILRHAEPADAEDIHALIVALAVYEREPHEVVCTPDDLRRQLEEAPPPFQCLLAEEGGEPRGFALYFFNYSTWRGRPGLYLEDLFVRPGHQGRGIGKRLLATLAAIAVGQGCARMEWSVLDWNTPAIDFYRALGAQPLDGWTTYRLTGDALDRLAGTADAVGD
jgi:GNAT superfamily N-acetyltransferase